MADKLPALFGGAPVALKNASNMANALRGAAQEAAGTQLPDGGVYVNFSGKMGKYSIGQDSEDADPNEVWLINVYSYEAGWVCWKGGQAVAKRFASVYGKPVDEPNLAEHGPFNTGNGEGWFRAKAFMMRSLDNGRQGYFATNTKSALREFAKVEGEIARRLEEGLPCWPIIQLKKEQFTAKGQKNWKPILEVYGWLGMKQVQQLATMELAEISGAIDDLIAQADDDEANGVSDTTMSDPDAADDFDYGEEAAAPAEDGIEDAETVEEEAEEESDGEAEEPVEEEVEEEPAPPPAARRRPAPTAAAKPAAPAGRVRRQL